MTAEPPPRWNGALLSGPVHGPLPALLLALTFATGFVDAVSVLALGRVFVANMTGNVVFLGFALAGTPGFDVRPALTALAGFLVGALVGGVTARHGPDRRRLLLRAALAELVLVVTATVLLAVAPARPGTLLIAAVAALLAVAMGVQTSTARHLGVPDLTTTVLTSTLTGFAADTGRTHRLDVLRRLLAVLTMLLGAVVGALLTRYVGAAWALAPVAAVLVGVAVALAVHDRHATWVGG